MKNIVRILPILILLILVIPANAAGNYSSILDPTPFGNTTISWRIVDAPDVPFSFYWAGTEIWLAEPESLMSFTIQEVSNDILGELILGNATLIGNDTDIAKDLTLGIWGITEFHPGLIIEISDSKINELNQTAFASAERVSGNYLNGTIDSSYEEITIFGLPYSCITFTYVQDDSGFGSPQRTYLAYDVNTGVLVQANTTYTFTTPYSLVLELNDVVTPLAIGPMILVGSGFAVIAVILVLRSKMNR
ncbi:MAG: hypothetical protein ACFFED_02835 [Candidatus Thorarchaeota archaeon]